MRRVKSGSAEDALARKGRRIVPRTEQGRNRKDDGVAARYRRKRTVSNGQAQSWGLGKDNGIIQETLTLKRSINLPADDPDDIL